MPYADPARQHAAVARASAAWRARQAAERARLLDLARALADGRVATLADAQARARAALQTRETTDAA